MKNLRFPCRAELVQKLVLGCALLGAPGLGLQAQFLKLPAVLSDHALLQRDQPAKLWGWVAPGAQVEGQANWPGSTAVSTQADAQGRFALSLPAPRVGGPYWIELRCEGQSVRIEDVVIGELWLCAGQSNMEMSVGGGLYGLGPVEGAEQVLKSAKLDNVRLFTVENAGSAVPEEDLRGHWERCTHESAARFSATGFFFGRELYSELGLPIGLISADWGGTPIESWLSAEGLAALPERREDLGPILATLEQERQHPGALELAARAAAEARWVAALESTRAAGARRGVQTLPGQFSDVPELSSFDGAVAFTRELLLPASWLGRELRLELGAIDDQDQTRWNGVLVGETTGANSWQSKRAYQVPAELVQNQRVLLEILVLDTGGEGGSGGPAADFSVYPAEPGALEREHLSLSGEFRFALGADLSQLPRLESSFEFGPWTPTALYNGMVAPLLALRPRGAIWYQGEANRYNAELYEATLVGLMADWARKFAREDFGFYYAEIAPFGYEGDRGETSLLREAQRRAQRGPSTVKVRCGMASTGDVGNPADIHPLAKKQVGERLAAWACYATYGRKNLDPRPPVPLAPQAQGRLLIVPTTRDGALECSGEPLNFSLAGADQRFYPARAHLEARGIVLSSEFVSAPVAARHAWGTADAVNVYSSDGMPMPPWRTDDWDAALPLLPRPPEAPGAQHLEHGGER